MNNEAVLSRAHELHALDLIKKNKRGIADLRNEIFDSVERLGFRRYARVCCEDANGNKSYYLIKSLYIQVFTGFDRNISADDIGVGLHGWKIKKDGGCYAKSGDIGKIFPSHPAIKITLDRGEDEKEQ